MTEIEENDKLTNVIAAYRLLLKSNFEQKLMN